MSLSFLGLGLRNAPVDRLEVRQAMALAINRDVLVSDSPIFRREAVGLIPPGMTAYSPSQKVLPYDPERARAILAEAGYSESNPVPEVVLYTASRSAAATRTLERIRADLEYVGIILDVRRVSWPELGEKIDAGKAPAFLLAMIAGLTDPDSYLRGMFDFDESETFFGFRDDECESLLAKGALELDPVKRSRIYRELERQILLRAPVVPLYHPVGMLATRKEIHGLEPSPAGMANLRLERVWMERGGASL
jgi:ABC-type transport system substrate-binding protein